MHGRPDIVVMSKVAEPQQVAALDRAVSRLEDALAIPAGSTELVPNVESARGIVNAFAIAKASPARHGCAGVDRGHGGRSRRPTQQGGYRTCLCPPAPPLRVHGGRRAVGRLPYTFADLEGCESDARYARQLGYVAKSAVNPDHVAAINRVLHAEPRREVGEARALVAAFEPPALPARSGAAG